MDLSNTQTTKILQPARRAIWRYLGGLLPVILLWGALATWLAVQLYERSQWSDEVDKATVQEWLSESRTFRQPLPSLVTEYVRLPPDDLKRVAKRQEIETQMKAMTEPMRLFANQLPTFPEIYSLTVELPGEPAIVWTLPLSKPPSAREVQVHPLAENPDVRIVCWYRMHPDNQLQQREEERRQISLLAGVLLVTATLLAAIFVWRFLRREHAREIERLTALAEAEHRERDLFAARLLQQEAESEQRRLHERASEAEKEALEVKSQIYASIGIMAGSYAHNIKNLLVRPNDLLNRSLEADGLSLKQKEMLAEVKGTLGTVTERLQEILRTVRRDPQHSAKGTFDLNDLVRNTVQTWKDTALEKWKLQLSGTTAASPLPIVGDLSHLQQAIENLLFNARDATFEMRNKLRDDARTAADRKDKLIAAAAWKGSVAFHTFPSPAGPVLEIRDNGIGMTASVKARCLETHFSTKRDNALYEGYSAGMGLGLSFVAMVVEQHGAKLEIESEPLHGATFRVLFSELR